MRIHATIWHLIGRLYQPAAWRILPLRAFKPSSGESADRGRVLFKLAAGWYSRPIKCQILARMRISESLYFRL